jgi:rubrerythrin
MKLQGSQTQKNLLMAFAGESQARNRYSYYAGEARYRALLEHVKNNTVFHREETTTWHCRNCGYVVKGKNAPETCPACKHPRSHYEVLAANYL